MTAVEDPLVPECYIITKSDPYNDNDTAPDANCMTHGTNTVSCPGRDGGRLFDMVEPYSNTDMKWKISHHWQASDERREVQVELLFSCPVNISAMTWHFFQDSNALPPYSANWSVTAVGENGRDGISQYITAAHRSAGMTTSFSMSSISGFTASRQWHVIIPMPPSQWLFLYEVGISGKMERIGEGKHIMHTRTFSCNSSVALPGRCCIYAQMRTEVTIMTYGVAVYSKIMS